MTDSITKVRKNYSVTGLTDRIKAALATITPESQALTAAQLAPSTRMLDLGCGLGGPAHYLAATFGCKVRGIDLSPAFIEPGFLAMFFR